MKKKFLIIVCILIVLGIINSVIYRNEIKIRNTDAYKFKVEYESLNKKKSDSGKKYRTLNIAKNNRIKYSTAKEIVKKIDNKESFIVYFGFAKCPWCRSMIENLLSLADKYKTDIYYVDVFDIRDVKELQDGKIVEISSGSSDYLKLLDRLGSVLNSYSLTDEDGNKVEIDEKRIYAPNVVAVVNGKAEKMTEGVSKDLKDPYGKLTKKMIKNSKTQLNCIFKCMASAGICTKPNSC